MATYEFWDTESGNRLGEYPDRDSALAYVREDITRGKANLWRTIALLELADDDNNGEDRIIAEGESLLALVRDLHEVRGVTATIHEPLRRALRAGS